MEKWKSNQIPRPEYPRPQMIRDEWINLNGYWEFEIDHGKSGMDRELYNAKELKDNILVPYCPESDLSGIGNKDFMEAVWYKREFDIPKVWLNNRIIIHFGAVDYETEVWINGESVGQHVGGYVSFSFDITAQVKPGVNTVILYVKDDTRSGKQPRGKQSDKFNSYGCLYTRTTGIWQTVWLECVPKNYISSLKIVPDLDNKCVYVEGILVGEVHNLEFDVKASYNRKNVGERKAKITWDSARVKIPLTEIHLWEPGKGRLYDLEICLVKDGKCIDRVISYFGLRSIALNNNIVLLNGKPVFQRLVLDQGFYPDGIYTAPKDEDLKKDIEISMAMGFNGARLHEKIFEPRFLYWADKLGYLVWGEHANWGLDVSTVAALKAFLPEWLEVLKRDYNHPSIIGWCPFNETQKNQDGEIIQIVYRTTKMFDPTRIVIDTSGYFHVETDMLDAHDYCQDPDEFTGRYRLSKDDKPVTFPNLKGIEGVEYASSVNFVSEYGGIWWSPGNVEGWGYGNRPKSEEEFLKRYERLTTILLNHPKMCAFCYTQLYDVEQEVNGLYTYYRKPKFDPEIIKAINSHEAAIESK